VIVGEASFDDLDDRQRNIVAELQELQILEDCPIEKAITDVKTRHV